MSKAHFSQKVGRSRAAMVAFLKGHFRYDTMNSWNAATSYANKIKLSGLSIPHALRDRAYAMLESDEWNERMGEMLRDFDFEKWKLGINGRSGGYIVLYSVAPGGADQGEDFDAREWSVDDLRARVRLVCAFDAACDRIVNEFLCYCQDYEVKDETVYVSVPRTVKRLVAVQAERR